MRASKSHNRMDLQGLFTRITLTLSIMQISRVNKKSSLFSVIKRRYFVQLSCPYINYIFLEICSTYHHTKLKTNHCFTIPVFFPFHKFLRLYVHFSLHEFKTDPQWHNISTQSHEIWSINIVTIYKRD
jgi:hypothetical protein